MTEAVGLKYCGGCSPRFDRVELAQRIGRRLAGVAELVPHSSPDACCILIVAGCPTACVDPAPFAGRRVFVVTGPQDEARVLEELVALLGGGPS